MKVRIIICCVAVLLTAFVVVAVRRGRAQGSSHFQPYTAYQHYETTGPSGKNRRVEERITVVSSKGDYAERHERKDINRVYRFVFYASGIGAEIYDTDKFASTTQEGEGPRPSETSRLANCIGPTDRKLREETWFGMPFIVKRTWTGRASWQSPSLGCIDLAHYVDWHESDNPGTNLSVLKLDNLVLGEPTPDMFVIPSDYKEMSPKLLQETISRRDQAQCGGCMKEEQIQKAIHNRDAQEKRYWAQRPKHPIPH